MEKVEVKTPQSNQVDEETSEVSRQDFTGSSTLPGRAEDEQVAGGVTGLEVEIRL